MDHFFKGMWGSFGTGDGELWTPEGIASFSGNSLLVVDSQNHRIQEFSRDGEFITKWGSRGNIPAQPNEFQFPAGVGINKTDSMHYIADMYNNRIQRFHWDPGVVGPFPDEIQEKLARLSMEQNKTMTEIVVLALKDYFKKRDRKDIKLST